MPALPLHSGPAPRGATPRLGRGVVALLIAAFLWFSGIGAAPVRAAELDLTGFDVTIGDEGVLLSYSVDFELSRAVDEALTKAVPLFFVAEAQIFSERWYWRDRRVAQAVRVWRIVYQPLTSTYRVTYVGGLSQNYASRNEAIAAIGRALRWKIAEPGQLEEGAHHYIEFNYRLDTSMLPRPMQIGIGGQADWSLAIERKQRIN